MVDEWRALKKERELWSAWWYAASSLAVSMWLSGVHLLCAVVEVVEGHARMSGGSAGGGEE